MSQQRITHLKLPHVLSIIIKTFGLFTLIMIIPGLTLADQQYITPNSNNAGKSGIYVIPQKSKQSSSQATQSIYQNNNFQQQAQKLMRQQEQQNAAANNQIKPINKQAIHDQVYAKPATQQSQVAAAQSTTQQNTASEAINNANTQAAASNANVETKVSPYTNEAKIAWFKSCMKSVKSGQGSAFANDFCGCGWRHIAQGELDPALLMSTKPKDIKLVNNAMAVITQQCIVEIEVNRNRKVEKK